MDEMPVCRASLFGRVLTHRRDHDAIAQLERAKSVRSEQRAHCLLSLSFLDRAGAEHRIVTRLVDLLFEIFSQSKSPINTLTNQMTSLNERLKVRLTSNLPSPRLLL
jgi:hypothetical protein